MENIHVNQMRPFTPITEELLSRTLVAQEYPVVAEAYDRPEPKLSESNKVLLSMRIYICRPLLFFKTPGAINKLFSFIGIHNNGLCHNSPQPSMGPSNET